MKGKVKTPVNNLISKYFQEMTISQSFKSIWKDAQKMHIFAS